MKTATEKRKISRGTLKRVLSYVKKYPLSLAFTLLFSAITVAFTLYIPVLIGDGIDRIAGVGKVDFAALKKIFVKIGLSLSVAAVSQWLSSVLNNRLAFHVVEDMRREAFQKLHALPLAYLDTHPRGDTLSRIVSDAEQFADGLLMGFTQFFTGALTILGTIGFMFAMGKRGQETEVGYRTQWFPSG